MCCWTVEVNRQHRSMTLKDLEFSYSTGGLEVGIHGCLLLLTQHAQSHVVVLLQINEK